MAFHLDFSPVLAKHSKNFSLENSLSIGVDRMQRNFEPMRRRWKRGGHNSYPHGLDADHVRTQAGQVKRRRGTRQQTRKVQHTDGGEWFRARRTHRREISNCR